MNSYFPALLQACCGHMNFSPVFPYPTRLSKAVTSIIMVLVSAMNLYFLATFLQNLPHRAYLGLLALPAVAYLGLTIYLVLGACSGERETPDASSPLGSHSCLPSSRSGPVASPTEPPCWLTAPTSTSCMGFQKRGIRKGGPLDETTWLNCTVGWTWVSPCGGSKRRELDSKLHLWILETYLLELDSRWVEDYK